MKTLSIKLLLSLISILVIHTTSAQVNYGFWSPKTPLSPQVVKFTSNLIATPQHVYFVAATNSKIYDTFWDPATLTWTPSGSNLGGTSCPAVKAGTNIVNYGEELFFVSSTDSKLYRLKWTSGPGWQYNIVHTGTTPVIGNKIFLRTHPSGCEIYYIGTGGKICQAYFDGVNWGPGAQLTTSQTINALSTSPIVVSGSAVYYIGSTDNRIYRVYWGGSSWTGGNAPLSLSSIAVRTGSVMVNETTDPDLIYYVNTSSQICELKYNGSTWAYSVIPSGGNTVSTTNDITCCYGSVFYARNDRKICRVWKTGSTWNNETPGIGAQPIQSYTQMYVWANDIIEEGTINTTFKSYHVFYGAAAPFNHVQLLIYDDKRVTFVPFGCFDECDNNGNGVGTDDPLPNTSPTPHPGYDCSQYNVGGIKPKEWYVGAISVYYNGLGSAAPITQYNKRFFCVGYDSKIYDFSRTPMNPVSKPGYGTPTWNDEFNGNHFNTTDWHRKDDAHPAVCYDKFWNSPLNANNYLGNMELVAHNIASSSLESIFPPETLPFARSQNIWVPSGSCLDVLPGDGVADNWATTVNKVYNYSSAFALTDQPGQPRVQFGYLESRFKIPRGKMLWPAFWFDNGLKQDFNFEFPGNGKVALIGLGHPTIYQPAIPIYAVGYRFYDDFYTYAVNWPDPQYGGILDLTFYLNNEAVYAISNNINPATGQVNCIDPHDIRYDIEVWPDVQAQCEPELFPSRMKIDYFRAWGSTIVRSPDRIAPPVDKFEGFSIYPNPATNTISINGDGFLKAEIFNVQGGKVMEGSKNTMDIEGLSKGIYLMRITNSNGRIQNEKFIKE